MGEVVAVIFDFEQFPPTSGQFVQEKIKTDFRTDFRSLPKMEEAVVGLEEVDLEEAVTGMRCDSSAASAAHWKKVTTVLFLQVAFSKLAF